MRQKNVYVPGFVGVNSQYAPSRITSSKGLSEPNWQLAGEKKTPYPISV